MVVANRPGTAVITVRTANGRTDSVTVTVPQTPTQQPPNQPQLPPYGPQLPPDWVRPPMPRPATPTNLRFRNTTHNSTELRWNPSNHAYAYIIYMRVDSQWIAIGATFGRDNVRLPIAGLDVDTRYRFTVVAIGIDEARSSRSATAEVRTDRATIWTRVGDFGSGIWSTVTDPFRFIHNFATDPTGTITRMTKDVIQDPGGAAWDMVRSHLLGLFPPYQALRIGYYVIFHDDFYAAGRLYGQNVLLAAMMICSLLIMLTPLGKIIAGVIKKTTNALKNQATNIKNKVTNYLANKRLEKLASGNVQLSPPPAGTTNTSQLNPNMLDGLKNKGIIDGGGRSGGNLPLTGTPNSFGVTKGGHKLVFDKNGRLLFDIDGSRVKMVKWHTNPSDGSLHPRHFKLNGPVPPGWSP